MTHTAPKLIDLENHNEFVTRHIGPPPLDQQRMLTELGYSSLEDLIAKVVPQSILDETGLPIDEGRTEMQALSKLKAIAAQNKTFTSHIGLGYYNCFTPNVILRNILENPAWYTAYTPYQPEISQGRLEALINFQTLVTDLTGMDLANASMLDEATAAAEAMTLCQRMSKSKSSVFFVDHNCFPQTLEVLATRAEPIGIDLVIGDPQTELQNTDCFGVLLQYPGSNGCINNFQMAITNAHSKGALVAMAADLLSLMLLKSPGELGADVAIGTSQRFGVPMGFGGPHAGYMAIKESFRRALPGRLVGVSLDSHGQPAYRLALQTREQHIRREKATSNICTAQALLAIMASMYAVYHGPDGLRRIAQRVNRLTTILAGGLRLLGYTLGDAPYFDTLMVHTGDKTEAIHKAATLAEINLRAINNTHIGISLDETSDRKSVENLWHVFSAGQPVSINISDLDASEQASLPEELLRTDKVLTHPVFNSYHSETEMLRYLQKLAEKDIALNKSMIPLGSCTMKLNATAEMLPVSWPQFSSIHPFSPEDQVAGYRQLTHELEQMLCAVTGYEAVSLQPNSGAQGEYAGLLAIRAYHRSRGEGHRNICLIPSSAHGTNPASAQMCGMKVVVVGCDEQGNVDVADLSNKCEQYSQQLSAIMVTYPSTHGVFEEKIRRVCEIVHDHGGQVYMDGANMNAMVGLCYPGKFGGDVSHLNLHKTFCIPHGGGGPGVGPIGVGKHLIPFLPGHRAVAEKTESAVSAISAAPWGSAGILPISWMYIEMMGCTGLKKATQVAILNANYIAHRLKPHYPILYTGSQELVAHECIIDLRPLKENSGVTVDDVAKRLIDYGFHAPTMSFPVAGTLMIEPTESESLVELERFCTAMIQIRKEIFAIETGNANGHDNPLKKAPHTAHALITEDWWHPYSREEAAYPVSNLQQDKYWSPVGRVDNVYGDRNLVCSCPATSEYE